jgi:hypothetical protein
VLSILRGDLEAWRVSLRLDVSVVMALLDLEQGVLDVHGVDDVRDVRPPLAPADVSGFSLVAGVISDVVEGFSINWVLDLLSLKSRFLYRVKAAFDEKASSICT